MADNEQNPTKQKQQKKNSNTTRTMWKKARDTAEASKKSAQIVTKSYNSFHIYIHASFRTLFLYKKKSTALATTIFTYFSLSIILSLLLLPVSLSFLLSLLLIGFALPKFTARTSLAFFFAIR